MLPVSVAEAVDALPKKKDATEWCSFQYQPTEKSKPPYERLHREKPSPTTTLSVDSRPCTYRTLSDMRIQPATPLPKIPAQQQYCATLLELPQLRTIMSRNSVCDEKDGGMENLDVEGHHTEREELALVDTVKMCQKKLRFKGMQNEEQMAESPNQTNDQKAEETFAGKRKKH